MNRLLAVALGLAVVAGMLSPAPSWAVDGDIVFQRKAEAGGTPPAIFPHWFHRIRYKCYACHPGIFQMRAGANAISMDAIQEGKFCGVCHDGKTAWAVGFDTCNRCHVER